MAEDDGHQEREATHHIELSAEERERINRVARTWDVIGQSAAMRRLAPEGKEIASAIMAGFVEVIRAIEESDG